MICRRSHMLACLLALCLVLPSAAGASGKGLSATNEQLQALFIQRLVKYVSWPEGAGPEPGKPTVIAATNAGEFKPYFTDDSPSARFKLVQWPSEDCHVLVVNGVPDREAAAILGRVAGSPVLTVGQSAVSLRVGAVVNFYRVGGKLRLQVSPGAAEKAGLFISSRLLQIARIYEGESDE